MKNLNIKDVISVTKTEGKDNWDVVYTREQYKGQLFGVILPIQEVYDYYFDYCFETGSEYSEECSRCYCGHTQYCSCSKIDIETFERHLEIGNIIFEENNGWK